MRVRVVANEAGCAFFGLGAVGALALFLLGVGADKFLFGRIMAFRLGSFVGLVAGVLVWAGPDFLTRLQGSGSVFVRLFVPSRGGHIYFFPSWMLAVLGCNLPLLLMVLGYKLILAGAIGFVVSMYFIENSPLAAPAEASPPSERLAPLPILALVLVAVAPSWVYSRGLPPAAPAADPVPVATVTAAPSPIPPLDGRLAKIVANKRLKPQAALQAILVEAAVTGTVSSTLDVVVQAPPSANQRRLRETSRQDVLNKAGLIVTAAAFRGLRSLRTEIVTSDKVLEAGNLDLAAVRKLIKTRQLKPGATLWSSDLEPFYTIERSNW